MQQFFDVVIRRMAFQGILRRNTSTAYGFQTRPCFLQGRCVDTTDGRECRRCDLLQTVSCALFHCCASGGARTAVVLRQELERARRADGRNGRTRLSECALTCVSGRAAREPRAFRRPSLPPVRRAPELQVPPEPGR